MIEIGTRVRILIALSAGLSTIGTVEAHDNSNLLEWNHIVRPENSDRTIALEESEIEIVEDEEHRGYGDQEDAYDRSKRDE